MGLDPLEIHLPTQVLAIHLTHVHYEKGIFFTRSAGIGVDTLDTLPKHVLRQLYPKLFAMTSFEVASWLALTEIDCCILLCECLSRKCHSCAKLAIFEFLFGGGGKGVREACIYLFLD